MQAEHRLSKAAAAHSEVLVAVFIRICRYDIVAVKLLLSNWESGDETRFHIPSIGTVVSFPDSL